MNEPAAGDNVAGGFRKAVSTISNALSLRQDFTPSLQRFYIAAHFAERHAPASAQQGGTHQHARMKPVSQLLRSGSIRERQ